MMSSVGCRQMSDLVVVVVVEFRRPAEQTSFFVGDKLIILLVYFGIMQILSEWYLMKIA